MAMVPTMGPIELFTNDEIIKDKDATTNIESSPIEKAHKNLHNTSS